MTGRYQLWKMIFVIIVIGALGLTAGCEVDITTPKYEVEQGAQIMNQNDDELMEDVAYFPLESEEEIQIGQQVRADELNNTEMSAIEQIIEKLIASRYCFHYADTKRNLETAARSILSGELEDSILESGYFEGFINDVVAKKVIIDVDSLEINQYATSYASADGIETLRIYCRINQTFRAYDKSFVTGDRVYSSGNANRRDLWVYLKKLNDQDYVISSWKEIAYSRLQVITFSPEGVFISEPGTDLYTLNSNNLYPLDSMETASLEPQISQSLADKATLFVESLLTSNNADEPKKNGSELFDRFPDKDMLQTWDTVLQTNKVAISILDFDSSKDLSIYRVKCKGYEYYMVEFQMAIESSSLDDVSEITTTFGTIPIGAFRVVVDVFFNSELKNGEDIVNLRFKHFDYTVTGNYE